MSLTSRRRLLHASAAVAVGAGGIAAVGGYTAGRGRSQRRGSPAHLRGSAPLPYAHLISLDLPSGGERVDALRAAHHVIRVIDGGRIAAWLALGEGAFAPGADRPRQLTTMPSFAGDVLNPDQSHGDLLLYITGDSARAVRHAAEQVLHALPHQQVRWRINGMRPDNRTEEGKGLARNPFHFTEGYGNPDTTAEFIERAAVRAGQGEPSWSVGGSYQVVRIVRLATDFWDNDTVQEQERIIGRRRDGRWLDGTPSDERPEFATDPRGDITPLDAHVRRAAPDRRHPPPMVRRSYNYHDGADNQGLIFSCFQRNLRNGFEAVQRRLQGEAMTKYTLTTGGGYYFVPPPGEAWLRALGGK
ncbi:Dyp-type peroxidase [Streptomyces sp. NPDC058847]|uniref:Dyp-type peroxidase n=1 Tax=Streptomyces sp. NPDC058847 TaxID=3346649 RepID=UPI0036AD9E0A